MRKRTGFMKGMRMMGRAERRRAQKLAQKEKTATYNLTKAQLDAAVREQVGKELERIKQEAMDDAINTAMVLLLTLPLEVLMDHYWTKSYAKRIPKFTELVLEYYERWQNGELDMEKLKEDLWEYLESKKTLKTVTLVAGEGEGADRRTTTVACASGAGTGLNRRELYTDARDVSSTVDNETLTDAEYNAQLSQRGLENLAENIATKSFEGKVETTRMYRYGEDFFLGDMVQIVNEYGIEGKARVTEFIRSQSKEGLDSYPTFVTVE